MLSWTWKARVSPVLLSVFASGMLGTGPERSAAQTTQPAATTRPAGPDLPTRVERRIMIAAPVNLVWAALHDKTLSDDWFPVVMASADLRVGGEFVYGAAEEPTLICEVLQLEEARRLVMRFKFAGRPGSMEGEPPSRVSYALSSWGPSTQLHLVHDELEGAPRTAMGASNIWDGALSRLKTLLETGRPLAFSYDQAREFEDRYKDKEPVEHSNPLAYIRGITLYVSKLKASRPWYEKAFNLPLSGFSNDWISLSMGSPAIKIQEVEPGESHAPGDVVFHFMAEDAERLYRRLEDRGVKFVQPLTINKYVKQFVFVSPQGQQFMVRGPVKPPASAPAESSEPPAKK